MLEKRLVDFELFDLKFDLKFDRLWVPEHCFAIVRVYDR